MFIDFVWPRLPHPLCDLLPYRQHARDGLGRHECPTLGSEYRNALTRPEGSRWVGSVRRVGGIGEEVGQWRT